MDLTRRQKISATVIQLTLTIGSTLCQQNTPLKCLNLVLPESLKMIMRILMKRNNNMLWADEVVYDLILRIFSADTTTASTNRDMRSISQSTNVGSISSGAFTRKFDEPKCEKFYTDLFYFKWCILYSGGFKSGSWSAMEWWSRHQRYYDDSLSLSLSR